jgi:heme oxygenase
MCERVSFLATTDGPLQLYFPPGLSSHAAARAGWGRPREGAECEWTSENPEALVVRHEDSSVRSTVRQMILNRYSTRSALLATVTETRGPNGFVVQYVDGKITPPKNGAWLMDLEIYSDDQERYEWLTTVTGDLNVREGATLTAPALTKTGDLNVYEGATLTAPKLTETGNLYVHKGAKLTAPALTETGNLYVHKGAKLTAPKLTTVTDDLNVREGATLTAPALTETGNLYVHKGAKLTAPKLTTVTGDLGVYEGATLTAPALTETGNLYVHEGAKLTAPALIRKNY